MKNTFARLFGSSSKEEEEVKEGVEQIAIELIDPNRYQPRTVFSQEKIEELALTIHTHGVIQPIVLRKVDERYEIVAGERRFRAMQHLGWNEVPALVRKMDDREVASVALIENLQREQLTAIEEAHAYAQLLELHQLTQEALAQRLGKSQSTIANKLRLLKLPASIQEAILNKKITERHARALLRVKEEEQQLQLLTQLLEEEWSVKQLEEHIKVLTALHMEEEKPKKKKPRVKVISKDVRIALNTIKQSVQLITKSGINVETEEIEEEDHYVVTVKIPKKK
ncbi:nucleoid occlusion protein [Savagea sp. SN6]|uniref:Nucleoid occlusion protein n=1 Tax=Savagea serpentis TaxID=2785297 RepID=A0A8J7GA72_9BACL|nr:nucleoid occlusion protein [Savagea serpentis]MBF4502128.1 nucleoid occlusion protein [Savagea serpentis]